MLDPAYQAISAFPAAYASQQPYGAHLRPSSLPSAAAAARADEVGPTVGDNLDHITVREVAQDRYSRNQQYMAEILSPYAVAEIVKPGIFQGVDTDWLTNLLVRLAVPSWEIVLLINTLFGSSG